MQIDWITVSAQIVNFLILVWLLKRFLYQPVIRAMDRREQRITGRLDEAEAREHEAEEQAGQYRQKREELEHERERMLDEAREEAAQEKKRLLEAARTEVAETRDGWHQQLEREKQDLARQLRHRTADAVQAIARKALRDLADASLEERVVDVFVERLKALDRDERKSLAEAGAVDVHSGFELDSRVRGRLTRNIHEHLAEGIEVNYERSDELLCGIRLSSENRETGWNLADYLEELEERIDDALGAVQARGGQD